MNSRNRLQPINELDALIRNVLRASVRGLRPAADTREKMLRRAAEHQTRRLLWLPISSAAWASAPSAPPWAGNHWSAQVYLYSPRLFKWMGFPAQIL